MTYLLDTNVLVYAVDENEAVKREQAEMLVARLGAAENTVLSAQVLAEFANAAIRRLHPPLPPEKTLRYIEQYTLLFTVIPLTPSVVLEAVRGVRDHRLSYYDAQICAAARLTRISDERSRHVEGALREAKQAVRGAFRVPSASEVVPGG